MQTQIRSQAPEGAVGYRLEVPTGGRPVYLPRSQPYWSIEPFEPPGEAGEGRYRIVWVGPSGQDLEDRGLPHVLEVWWVSAAAETAEQTAARLSAEKAAAQHLADLTEARQRMARLEAELERTRADLSEASELARLRGLVSDSGQRESAAARRELEMAEKASAVVMSVLGAALQRAEQLQAPAPPPQPMDWTQPIGQTIGAVRDVTIALINNRPQDAARRLGMPAPPLSPPAPPSGDARPTEGTPAAEGAGEPKPAETPPAPAPDEQAYRDLASHLTDAERAEMAAAMRDPARIREFLERSRKKEVPRG